MEDNFEEGKHLLVEGFRGLLKFYDPFFKIVDGLKIIEDLEFWNTFEAKANPEDMLLIKIGFETFIETLRKAKNRKEIQEALEENKRWCAHMGLS